jgi:uncharacterized protein
MHIEGLESRDADQLKDLILTMAVALADYPENIKIEVATGRDTIVFELNADKQDLAKMIGKHGKNADAIRVILNAAGTKLGKKCYLRIP